MAKKPTARTGATRTGATKTASTRKAATKTGAARKAATKTASTRKAATKRASTSKTAAPVGKKPTRTGSQAHKIGKKRPTETPTTAARNTMRPAHACVRMYNNILGDCFLLRFPVEGGQLNVLIDCGALQGMPDATAIMRRIAADIESTTEDPRTQKSRIDILVATHEHVDHLSGFAQARDVFDRIDIGELWLAWTEDESDPDAARIRDRRHKTLELLQQLDRHIPRTANADTDPEQTLETNKPACFGEVSQLFAFTGETPRGATGDTSATTSAIIAYLKGRAQKVRYFEPGSEPIPLPTEVPVQVYVLGPPKDDKLLKRSNPRKGEVYLSAESDDLAAYLAAAIQLDKNRKAFDPDEERQFALEMPFDATHIRCLSELKATGAGGERYFDPQFEWRQIDRDWLGAAQQLALRLDSDTNNTSLVLAFVCGEGANRRVMLFPGDAQVGSWESWQQYVWPKSARREDPSAVAIEQLFASTVLYKVGHHASHNATLKAAGLELMVHPELTAMIPVKEEFARGSKGWNMPFPALLARITEKTKGRVLRADRSLADLVDERKRRADGAGEMSGTDWDEFLSRVVEGPQASKDEVALYVDYFIPLA